MRRGRIFIYLGLILILGLVAVFLLISRQAAPPPTTPGAGEVVPTEAPTGVQVVITTQRIARGEEITEGVIEVVEIPQEQLIEGMFTEEEQVIGRLARYDLDPGVFLTTGNVTDSPEGLSEVGSDHALFIPEGMVAVSIPVDRLASVSYGLSRGDHVNVIVTLLVVDMDTAFQTILPNNSSSVIAPGPAMILAAGQPAEGEPATSTFVSNELLQTLTAQIATGGVVSPIGRVELDQTLGQPLYIVPSESQRPRSVSQTLIQDVIVLQLGNFPLQAEAPAQQPPDQEETPEEQPPPEEGNQQQPPPQPELPDVITLIVTPQDAVTLNYLLYTGAKLSLALRGAGDETQVQTEAVTLQFLLDQYNIPIPAKLPYGLEPRIDVLEPPTLLNDALQQLEEQQ